jgi:hypothetical protein
MWSLIERLPAEVQRSHVFAMLASKDIPKLDEAVLNKKARLVLIRWYRSVALITSSKKKTSTVEVLSWCIRRGLHMTNLDVSNCFQEALHLLLSQPTALTELLVLHCCNQADFDEIQNELAQLPVRAPFTVRLELDAYSKQPFQLHNAQIFHGKLSGFTWSTKAFSGSQASLLLADNTARNNICIQNPTPAEIRLVCSLRALQKLSLDYAAAETDTHLAVISRTCRGLQHLSLYGATASDVLDRGLAALAESCASLLTIEILGFAVSDAAITALCAHCPKLFDVNLPTGRLTSEALMALSESGARWKDVTIGWNVHSVKVAASNAHIFSHVLVLRLMSPDPASADTLGVALAFMPLLESFTVEFSHFPAAGTPHFPAQHLLAVAQNSPNLADLRISHPVSGASEKVLVRLFSSCSRLRRFNSGGCGLKCTDNVLLAIAASCPCITTLHVCAEPALTDAGVIAIARQCPALQDLSINGADGLTDAALGALARHSRRLRSLELSNSSLITEIAQLYLLHRCTALTYMRLPQCPLSVEGVTERDTILQSRCRTRP